MNPTRLILALAALLAFPSASPAAEPLRVTVDLNVRSGPGAKHDVIDSLTRGEAVEVTGRREGWSRIGRSRWVRTAYLGGGRKSTRPRDPDAIAEMYNTTSTSTGIPSADPVFGQKPSDGWNWERMHLLRHAH